MSVKEIGLIPSLNGLRAVAIIIVFLSHAGLGDVIPGRFGVTLFFFLSGFLITTLLRVEFEKYGNINIKNFYMRRIFRILPPMYITYIMLLLFTMIGFMPGELLALPVLSQLLHFTNYLIIYNGTEGIPLGTQTFWSLSVEEHFYLMFPFLFLYFVTNTTYLKHAFFLLLICIIVLAWRIVLVRVFGEGDLRLGLATDTRIDSILFGCIMAICFNPVLDKPLLTENWKKLFALFTSIVLLLFSFLYRDMDFRGDLRYTIQNIAMFPLFYVLILAHDWPLIRILNYKLINFLGVLSFSFYLCHDSFIIISKHWLGGVNLLSMTVAFVASVSFSYLMYFFVETRLVKYRKSYR